MKTFATLGLLNRFLLLNYIERQYFAQFNDRNLQISLSSALRVDPAGCSRMLYGEQQKLRCMNYGASCTSHAPHLQWFRSIINHILPFDRVVRGAKSKSCNLQVDFCSSQKWIYVYGALTTTACCITSAALESNPTVPLLSATRNPWLSRCFTTASRAPS